MRCASGQGGARRLWLERALLVCAARRAARADAAALEADAVGADGARSRRSWGAVLGVEGATRDSSWTTHA